MIVIDRGNENADLEPSSIGYTIYGAANAVAQRYGVPEFVVRTNIIHGICSGLLIIRNKFGFVSQSFEADMQNDRISIIDLNNYFEAQRVTYRLDVSEEFARSLLGNVLCEPQFEKHSDNQCQNSSEPNESKVGMRINEIIKCAKHFEYDVMSIPEGGKVKIKAKCLKDNRVFHSESGFDKAWKQASKNRKLRVENYNTYVKGRE